MPQLGMCERERRKAAELNRHQSETFYLPAVLCVARIVPHDAPGVLAPTPGPPPGNAFGPAVHCTPLRRGAGCPVWEDFTAPYGASYVPAEYLAWSIATQPQRTKAVHPHQIRA